MAIPATRNLQQTQPLGALFGGRVSTSRRCRAPSDHVERTGVELTRMDGRFQPIRPYGWQP
jgi:hypothetical protein